MGDSNGTSEAYFQAEQVNKWRTNDLDKKGQSAVNEVRTGEQGRKIIIRGYMGNDWKKAIEWSNGPTQGGLIEKM